MEQILFMSFDRRLAIFLMDEYAKTRSKEIPLTHEEIAKLMGSAREVVSRMMKYFAQEGIVSLSRGGLTAKDQANEYLIRPGIAELKIAILRFGDSQFHLHHWGFGAGQKH